MNRTKILSIMPYILAILILALVGVIVFTGLGSYDEENPDNKPTQSVVKNDDSAKKNDTADADTAGKQDEQTNQNAAGDDATAVTPAQTADNKTDETKDETPKEETKEPVATPTTAPAATEAPKPTEAVIDLTFGFVFESRSDYVDTKDGVNLRSGCSTDTDKVAFLEQGMRLQRTGFNDNWTRVIYNGQECYIATRLIIREVDSYDAVVTPEASADDAGTTQAADAGQTSSDGTVKTADASDAADNNTDNTGAGATASDSFTKVSWYGAGAGKTVCIDPGHQTKGNSEKEPLGPGSSVTKAKVSSGTAGVVTGLEEYKLNLTVSLKLRDELTARGYNVIMTRTTNDVDLSNIDRAQIANDANADAFIRIHANSASNSEAKGAETLCMTDENEFNAYLYKDSHRLSADVLSQLCARTGAIERYVYPSDSYSGINWSKVPVTIVEMGYMSNPDEDRLLSTEEYQNKIVVGIADGIDKYFSK